MSLHRCVAKTTSRLTLAAASTLAMLWLLPLNSSAQTGTAPQATPPLSALTLAALRQKAESGDVRAEAEMGRRLYAYANEGAANDYGAAAVWFRKAADKGDAEAEDALGKMYVLGDGVPKDPVQGVAWLRKAANQQFGSGELDLGGSYFRGDGGLPRDPAQAQIWFGKALSAYTQAAARQDVEAERALGDVYLYGLGGVEEDRAQAISWYRKAADQGDPEAEANMGTAYLYGQAGTRDYHQALAWFRKAAGLNQTLAEVHIGDMYENGDGVPSNPKEALAWYLKAAAETSPIGEARVASMYCQQGGTQVNSSVTRDYGKALRWFHQAADQGYWEAEDGLAAMYYSGQGVPQDYRQALYWYKKSAAQGELQSMNIVGTLYYNGTGMPKDYAKALVWYRKAAALGDANGETNLGNMYYSGQGVRQDYSQAAVWYKKAADHNYPDAENALGFLYERGQGVQADDTQALAWYQKAAAQGSAAAQRNLQKLKGELAQAQSAPRQAQRTEATSQAQTDESDAPSAAEWQQDHQAKIDELTQEIANHEQQAQQDDANADEAEAQVQQNESANVSGPGGAFLALGNAVEGGMNAGLAESERQDAADERRQAQEEREQLSELGAEQPPVAQNDSETMALTRMQTQAIQSGNTLEGQMNRARSNIQPAPQGTAEENAPQRNEVPEPRSDAQSAGSSASGGNVTYAQPAMNCLAYTAAGQYDGVGVWATNSCSYEIEITWATPSAPATGNIILNAGERIFVPAQPVKVFACTVIKGNGMSGNRSMGIYKTYDAATNQSTPPTYDDPRFVCPVYPVAP